MRAKAKTIKRTDCKREAIDFVIKREYTFLELTTMEKELHKALVHLEAIDTLMESIDWKKIDKIQKHLKQHGFSKPFEDA